MSTTSFRVEAENIVDLQEYESEMLGAASNGEVLRIPVGNDGIATTGTITFDLDDVGVPAGQYTVVLGYFDENDGEASYTVALNNTLLDSFTADQDLGSASAGPQTATTRAVASNVLLNAGDTFTITGTEDQGEFARIDFIEFVPFVATPGPGPQFRIANNSAASGGQIISLIGEGFAETATAAYELMAPPESMTWVIGYFDETDGISRFRVEQDGTLLSEFDADEAEQLFPDEAPFNEPSAQALTSQTIATGIQINPGEIFTVTGTEGLFERARVDYLEFQSATPGLTFRVEAETFDLLAGEPRFRFEAEEDLRLTNFAAQTASNGFGEGLISLINEPSGTTGTASLFFNGPTGEYDVILTYLDENDGQSHVCIRSRQDPTGSVCRRSRPERTRKFSGPLIVRLPPVSRSILGICLP